MSFLSFSLLLVLVVWLELCLCQTRPSLPSSYGVKKSIVHHLVGDRVNVTEYFSQDATKYQVREESYLEGDLLYTYYGIGNGSSTNPSTVERGYVVDNSASCYITDPVYRLDCTDATYEGTTLSCGATNSSGPCSVWSCRREDEVAKYYYNQQILIQQEFYIEDDKVETHYFGQFFTINANTDINIPIACQSATAPPTRGPRNTPTTSAPTTSSTPTSSSTPSGSPTSPPTTSTPRASSSTGQFDCASSILVAISILMTFLVGPQSYIC